MILTIALPESLREQGNQFARCIGMGPDDDKTFDHEAAYQDAEGNRYIVTSGWVVDHFADIATGEIVEPPWGCDLEAAQVVQGMISLEDAAGPQVVAARFSDDLESTVADLGLQRISDPADLSAAASHP
jgi:hypothetical protein